MKTEVFETHQLLKTARRNYCKCASKLENKIKEQGYMSTFSNSLISLGMTISWLERASEMEKICYARKDSPKKDQRFVEIIRFGFSWYAIDSLLSRKEILALTSASKKDNTQIKKFLCHHQFSSLSNDKIIEFEASIKKFLMMKSKTRLPDKPDKELVTALEVINVKCTSDEQRKRGISKQINEAIIQNDFGSLDLSTLLYAFRNWTVHGNVFDGSFGNKAHFLDFIIQLNLASAEIHLGISEKLIELI